MVTCSTVLTYLWTKILLLREAVYSYFKHKFTYADEKKARFYFEKPYWERTPEEIRAAGF